MKCPFCGDPDSKVLDTRRTEDNLGIRRRRECTNCMRRFSTREAVETVTIIVVKRNGSRQPFDRNKIISSMMRAFDKRRVDVQDLERIAGDIEMTLQNSLESNVSSEQIGCMVMEQLKPLDEVAYIRFASIYHRFQDAQSFLNMIGTYLEEKS